MNKQEFLAQLRNGLSGLPREDMEERLTFYSEMIEDRMEDGLSEEDAVGEIGRVDDIVCHIIADTPFAKLVKERIQPKKSLKAWEITLLVLGSPIWLSLAVAAVSVVLSLYIVLWAVIVSLWAVFGSLIGCALGGIAGGVVFALNGNGLTGTAVIGVGIVCVGLSIFLFYGCKAATKGAFLLAKRMAYGLKNGFARKGEAS